MTTGRHSSRSLYFGKTSRNWNYWFITYSGMMRRGFNFYSTHTHTMLCIPHGRMCEGHGEDKTVFSFNASALYHSPSQIDHESLLLALAFFYVLASLLAFQMYDVSTKYTHGSGCWVIDIRLGLISGLLCWRDVTLLARSSSDSQFAIINIELSVFSSIISKYK